jgi:plastocyanin
LGNAFSPNCLAVAAGQQVTFTGSFTTHPLAPGAAASAGGGAGSPNNPIQSMTSGNTVTFTFPTAGTYPYFCSAHQNLGMYGAIQVR